MTINELFNILYYLTGVFIGIVYTLLMPHFSELMNERLKEIADGLIDFEHRNDGGDDA